MRKGVVLLLLVALSAFTYVYTSQPGQDPFLLTDYSRLHPVKVKRIVKGQEMEQLVQVVQDAAAHKLKVAIAGQRHSQGGHTYYKDAVVVDMTAFNHVLNVDAAARTVTVQAGATWADVQRSIQPYGLAVRTMQSQNIFTVGGSISVNAHGRDIRNGSLIKSVLSYRLLTADGRILEVSRTENAELFPLALGGYGLFGIILDVTLSLVPDEMYQLRVDTMPADDYVQYFRTHVLGNPDVRMHLARVSVGPGHFLTDMYALNYEIADKKKYDAEAFKLRDKEQWVTPVKALFQLNRLSDQLKDTFWDLQLKQFKRQEGQLISRNNAMRSDTAFMETHEPGRNDLLQEYFIPMDEYADFLRDFGTVLKRHKLDLLNITVRYVDQDEEAALSYARKDMFALVCLFRAPLGERGQEKFGEGIRAVVDQAIAHGGTYYLPYAGYPTRAQLHAAYPKSEAFFQLKRKYDPDELFYNVFYEQYGAVEGEQR
ncbi:FAD-binding oxidoreductase [Paenibacillus sp. MMS18-CY102]|uniref:FAD-binding oxidoreductase n=1 Tax=Paenibacillus sp. MMS18-CY102 TaxID=2682849 RepID=UPI0013656CD8|nr:FAD-binding oxidoreductase [Paenibacillus sp. MMS18-CY102]MWC29822.1 FAD-binding protein [Paenibacillus sp. MMS18-CY102]